MLSQALAGGLKPEHWSIGVNYFMAKMKDAEKCIGEFGPYTG
jgi:hypothetical protein